MREIKLRIGGLHCEGCVQSVVGILRARPDVRDATVQLATGEATVAAGDMFDLAEAQRAVRAAGFTVDVI